MCSVIKRVIADERGATVIEYGLLAALLSLAGVAGFTSMGSSLDTLFTSISAAATNAVN